MKDATGRIKKLELEVMAWNFVARDCDHCDRLVTVVTVWWPNFFATVRRQCPR